MQVKGTRSAAFELLHPALQRWIRRKRWTSLRKIQEDAVGPILQEERDVVIAAATAGGKTEAAFLPIATRIADDWEEEDLGALSVLYVSPLKALINDQFRRLEDLFKSVHVPVFRWHGDVSGSRKRTARKKGGVLLITPESLEAQFIRRGYEMGAYLAPLRYVVVDELHAFIGTERGRQLQSLLHRVELTARRQVPRIALSATLADERLAAEFLRPGAGDRPEIIADEGEKQTVQLQVRGYEHKPASESQDSEDSGGIVDISRHIYDTLRGGWHLVFANSRAMVETCTDLLRQCSERDRVPDEFMAHHGSLSRTLREEAESRLKDEQRPATIIATTTLELGIDVGKVESIAQIGPPPSVASMRQRLGRSGRNPGQPAVLRVYVHEPELERNSSLADRLRVRLVRSIAMVLLLIEGKLEPPVSGALHLSTLVQQILSLIAQHGGLDAMQGYDALCRYGPFKSVTAQQYANVLRDLGRAELITQTHDDTLVLDLNGERLVNHYDFYAAFTTPDEYRLVANGRELGSLPIIAPLYDGQYLIFGGRRWKVVAVDMESKVVDLVPAPGGRPPSFGGTGALVDTIVRRKMRAVYESSDKPVFVDPRALKLLSEARQNYRRMELDRRGFFQDGTDTLWFPWTGDRALNVLALALRREDVKAQQIGPILRAIDTPLEDLRAVIARLAKTGFPGGNELARLVQNKRTEKHHVYLREELLAADYASRYFDYEGAGMAMAIEQ